MSTSTGKKQIMVGLYTTRGVEPVGIIEYSTAENWGSFSYLSRYNGPPLDPANLDYRKPWSATAERPAPKVFRVNPRHCPNLVHRVFEDAMPGVWGQLVLEQKFPEITSMKTCERLSWLGTRTAGALNLFVVTPADEQPAKGIKELAVIREESVRLQQKSLPRTLVIRKETPLASHGGAMPKTSFQDENGDHWLAKFNSVYSCTNYTRLEYAAMRMAAKCGIAVPTTKILDIPGTNDTAFLIRRYDRVGESRAHKISMFSLADPTAVRQHTDGDYRMIFAIIDKTVHPSARDRERLEMLRRMVFNVGLNILDDHLRNHEMLMDVESGEWSLSPAYDLIPFPNRAPHHCKVFGCTEISLDMESHGKLWKRIADEIKIPLEDVRHVIETTRQRLIQEWPKVITEAGLSPRDTQEALESLHVGCHIALQSAPGPKSGRCKPNFA